MRAFVKRRALAVLGFLSVVAMLSAACGQGAQSPAAGQSTSAKPSSSSAAASPAAKQGQGITKDTIKVGTSQPLTGQISQSGAELVAGLELGVKVVNDGGGINGRKLELIKLDDAYETPRQVANIRRLTEQEQVFALLGVAGSGLVPASYDYTKEKGIPLFAPVLPPDPNYPNVFLIGTGHTDQTKTMMDYLAATKKVKTLVYIYMNDDLGTSIKKGMDEQAKKNGIQVLAELAVERGATDVSAVVLKAKEADPDAVFFGTATAQSVMAMKEIQKLGWKPIMAGESSSVGGLMVPQTSGSAGEGLIGAATAALVDSSTPDVQKFREAMQKYFPDVKAYSSYHIENYGRTLVFAEVLKRMGDDLTWDNFIKTAESLKDVKTGIFPPVSFSSGPGGHTGTIGIKAITIQNGKWVELTDFMEPKK